MLIYDTKIIVLVNCKQVYTKDFPWYLSENYFLFWLHLLKSKACGAVFTVFSIYTLRCIQYMDCLASGLVFSMPMWLIWSWFMSAAVIFLL